MRLPKINIAGNYNGAGREPTCTESRFPKQMSEGQYNEVVSIWNRSRRKFLPCEADHKGRQSLPARLRRIAGRAQEDTPSVGTGHAREALDGWKQPEGFDSPVLLTPRPTNLTRCPAGTLGVLTQSQACSRLRLLRRRAQASRALRVPKAPQFAGLLL